MKIYGPEIKCFLYVKGYNKVIEQNSGVLKRIGNFVIHSQNVIKRKFTDIKGTIMSRQWIEPTQPTKL